jgi:indole-3-acetate monooxygenase
MSTTEPPIVRAQTLAATIDAAVPAIESSRRLTPDVLAGLYETGLLRLLLPRSAGGEEVHPCTYLHVVTALAQHDGSVAWNVFVANSSALIAAFLQPEIATEIFAHRESLVAWGPPNNCIAKATQAGYEISGEWSFASGCRHATWMGIHCPVQGLDGELQRNQLGAPAIRTLLFPSHLASLIDNWNTIGLRGTASDGYTVANLCINQAYSATREDPEGRLEQGPLYAIPMQGLYAVGVAAVAAGIARAMLDEFIELAKSKIPRGQGRLADSVSVQSQVARSEVQLSAALAWLDRVLEETYRELEQHPVPAIDIPVRAKLRLACSHVIQSAVDVADATYRLAGVSTIFAGNSMERRFRDIHTVSQQIQSRPSHFESIGQVLLGNPPAVFY